MIELPEDLAHALRVLDARAVRRAEQVDPERVAARVLERLRTEDAPVHRVLPFGFRLPAPGYRLAIAASLAVLVIGGTMARSVVQRETALTAAVPVAAQVLDSLSQAQLESVLEVAGQVRPVLSEYSGSSSSSLEDLNEQQLRTLLQVVQQTEGGTL